MGGFILLKLKSLRTNTLISLLLILIISSICLKRTLLVCNLYGSKEIRVTSYSSQLHLLTELSH